MSSPSALSLSDADPEKVPHTPTSASDTHGEGESAGIEKGGAVAASARALLASPNVRVLRGRPDVAHLLGEALQADGNAHVSVGGAFSLLSFAG